MGLTCVYDWGQNNYLYNGCLCAVYKSSEMVAKLPESSAGPIHKLSEYIICHLLAEIIMACVHEECQKWGYLVVMSRICSMF